MIYLLHTPKEGIEKKCKHCKQLLFNFQNIDFQCFDMFIKRL
jgi:hypothetical protein